MPRRLSHTDFDACSRALRELYAETSLSNFPNRLLTQMMDLVPSGYLSWNAFDQRKQIFYIAYCPERPELKAFLPQFSATIHTSPLYEHFQSASIFPKKTTDVMTLRQFQETAIYREYYRHTGTKHQVIFSLPQVETKTHVSLALNRPNRDFSERDRAVLTFLSPHMAQAYRNARLHTELAGNLKTVGDGLDVMRRAVILSGPTGRIHWQSKLAREWLGQFFPGNRPTAEQLPLALAGWLDRMNKTVYTRHLTVSQMQLAPADGCRLLVLGGRIKNGYILVLMRERMGIEPVDAQRLNLTPREAEILYWMSEAKNRMEIATILKVSWRTVGKHMEHIFAKLGVASQLEAQRIGLELRKM